MRTGAACMTAIPDQHPYLPDVKHSLSSMFHFIQALLAPFRAKPSNDLDWFHVTFDDTHIHLDVRPPKRDPWKDRVAWSDIDRVGLELTDLWLSDDLYIFASDRPESRLIPMEADGGQELWFEIMDRGLFPHAKALDAMCQAQGLFFWPEPGSEPKAQSRLN